MASVLNQSEDRDGPRLVLRQVEPEGAADQVWELADPWDPERGSPPGVAVTRRVGDMMTVERITVREDAPQRARRSLVQQLVVLLRRTDVSLVSCSTTDAVMRAELVAAGFVSIPEESGAAPQDGRATGSRLILQL